MRATVFHAPFDVRIEQVRDAALQEPTDALVRITHAAICGSDLWPYRGLEPFPPGGRLGHEWMGMVEDVGSQVTTIKRGDRVIAPFAFSDGTCEFCHKGLYTNCLHGGFGDRLMMEDKPKLFVPPLPMARWSSCLRALKEMKRGFGPSFL